MPAAFRDVFEEPIGRLLLDNQRLQILVFEEQRQEVMRWIPEMPTGS